MLEERACTKRDMSRVDDVAIPLQLFPQFSMNVQSLPDALAGAIFGKA